MVKGLRVENEVDVILRQENIDIAVVTESWFSPKNIDYSNIHGYCMYSKSREIRTEGGVAIFVRNGIPSKSLDIEVPDEFVECVWIEVRPYRLPRGISAITICGIYIVTDSPTSRAAKTIHCAQNVKTMRLCTEFNRSINNIFLICHILWHFQDGRH